MMQNGIIARMDDLGRIVIPKEIRDCKFLDEESELELFVEDDTVILKRFLTKDILRELISEIRRMEDLGENMPEIEEHLLCIENCLKQMK